MTQPFSKLKIISRPASSRSKPQSLKTQPNLNSSKKQTSSQTQQKKTLITCQSSKSLYKEKYQQCEERLGEENQYLRDYVMDINVKLSERDMEIQFLKENNEKLKGERDQLENQIKSLEESEKNKHKEYQDSLQELRRESSQRVIQCTININSLKEMIGIRQKCISQLRSNINTISTENENLKNQIDGMTRSNRKQFNETLKSDRRRAKSTFNGIHLKELIISEDKYESPELSPKQAARMDVLMDQYNELKSAISKGNMDNGTGFRLITLIQYLKQTLSKKNLEILQLKQVKKCAFKGDPQLIQRYQKTIFQSRQQIQSLQCQIRMLKDHRVQWKNDIIKPISHRNRSNFDSNNSSRRNSNTSIIHMSGRKESKHSGLAIQLERLMNKEQENNWRIESTFSQTQHLPYRQIAKKQLINKLDSNTSFFNDTKRIKQSGGLSERKNSSYVTQSTDNYTKYDLNQFLQKRNNLITYMTLVVKITEIVDKMIKSQIYRILTTKDIIVMVCEGYLPDSLKMKCQLKTIDSESEFDKEYSPPESIDPTDELTVMWSIGVVFRKIYESIQTDNSEEQGKNMSYSELFNGIVKPQFNKIIESLLVEQREKRINMNQFKEMLTTLS